MGRHDTGQAGVAARSRAPPNSPTGRLGWTRPQAGNRVPLAGPHTSPVAYGAREVQILPVESKPPVVVGQQGAIRPDDSTFRPKVLDIPEPRGIQSRLTVGAFAVEQFPKRLANLRAAERSKGEPALASIPLVEGVEGRASSSSAIPLIGRASGGGTALRSTKIKSGPSLPQAGRVMTGFLRQARCANTAFSACSARLCHKCQRSAT